ncbi:hypothetical protein HYZ82_03210 [Candidatus Nomurabacteria bacterium]|nr:hypothetical protein [Candidatus Nomurabacteria bacterium]
MSHVSGKKLKRKTWDRISKKLIKTFEDAGKDGLPSFLNELFTNTEKKMLSKRLAIIILLHKEIPQHRIAEMLHVSSSTVTRMSLNIEIGKYNSILKVVGRRKGELVGLIEYILTVGGTISHRAGRGRWTRIFKDLNG